MGTIHDEIPHLGLPPCNHETPESSFKDDVVGALIKSKESAQRQIHEDRITYTVPERIHQAAKRVEQAPASCRTQDGLLLDHSVLVWGQVEQEGLPLSIQTMAGRFLNDSSNVENVEQRLENLLAWMDGLLQSRPSGGRSGEDGLTDETARAAYRQSQQLRLIKLETQAKYYFQWLLSGGMGLSFLGDWRLTFRRLFDRIGKKWPKNLRPGSRPETDEDLDAFMAWVYAPSELPEDAEFV